MLSALRLLGLCLVGQIVDASPTEQIPSVIRPPAISALPPQWGDGSEGAESNWRTPGVEGISPHAASAQNTDALDDLSRKKSQATQYVEETLRAMLGGMPKSNQAGESLTLLAAVAASNDPRQQQLIINTYWRLVEASAVRGVRQTSTALLQDLSSQSGDDPLVRCAATTSLAKLKDAEVAMVSAQHEMAALLERPSDAPLPLPADVPHVGDYRTRFAESFRGRSAPAIAIQLDRTLPLYQEVIHRRLAAFEEYETALQTTLKAWKDGKAPLADVIAVVREASRQREAFLAAITRYNLSIADYAYATSAPTARPEAIVGMLIKPPYPLVAPGPANNLFVDPAVHPAGFNETLGSVRPGRRSGPTPANPDTRPAVQGDLPLGLRGAKAALPAQSPITLPSSSPTTIRAHKPMDQEAPAANAGAPFRISTSSQSVSALARDDSSLSQRVEGSPITLAEALAAAQGDRRSLIEAYWQASRRAAELSLLEEHTQRIRGMLTTDGGRLYLKQRVKASALAAEAATVEWKTVWLDAQCRLAVQLGRENDAVWLLPVSPMHHRAFELPANPKTTSGGDLWRMKRMAALVLGLEQAIAIHAIALEQTTNAWNEESSKAATAPASIGAALQSASAVTEEAMALLDDVTARNLAIADLTLAVLPPNVPSDTLAAAMVPQP